MRVLRALTLLVGIVAMIGFGVCGVWGFVAGIATSAHPKAMYDFSGLAIACGLIGIVISLIIGYAMYRFAFRKNSSPPGAQ